MRNDERRRLRAAVAMACCLSAALAGGWTEGAASDDADRQRDGAPDAADRLRAEVERQAAGLREELDRAEREQDWGELAARKAAVDAILAPLHLVRDAMVAAQDPRPGAPIDLLRSLRTEWRDETVRSSWCDAATGERARDWVRAWTPAPGTTRTYRVRVGTERWVGTDAPPLAEWLIAASWEGGTPVIEARCECMLPVADARRVAFPLPADGFTIRWDAGGASYSDPKGRTHAERWPQQPIFNNPPDHYAAFDGLRLSTAADFSPGEAWPPAESPSPWQRTVSRGDGTPVRRERWSMRDGAVSEVESIQEPISLVHHAPQGAEIVTEVAGEAVGRAAHRASSAMAMPAMRWTIEAPAPGAAPGRWTLWVDGAPAAWAEFAEAVPAAVGGPGATGALAADAADARALVDRAIATRSPPLLQDAALAIERMHAAHAIPRPQREADRRLLRERAAGADFAGEVAWPGEQEARTSVADFPRPDARTLESMQAAWDACAREGLSVLREAFRRSDAWNGDAPAAAEAVADLRRRLDALRATLGSEAAPQFDAALAAPAPDAGAVRARMRTAILTAVARESRRAAVVNRLLGEELGRAREDAGRRRTADAAMNAVTDEYLRWVTASAVPVGQPP